jgi:hypothetical protein
LAAGEQLFIKPRARQNTKETRASARAQAFQAILRGAAGLDLQGDGRTQAASGPPTDEMTFLLQSAKLSPSVRHVARQERNAPGERKTL